jgi:teichuronic acid exporter
LQRVFQLGAGIVVARLLLPTDFAIAGLAGAVAGIFSILAAHGFGLALVQAKELSDTTIHTVFWLLTFIGIFLGGTTALISPFIAKLYNLQTLVPVMIALALNITIGMMGSVPGALLERAMRFREINIITAVGGAIAAVLGISIAWLGYGYWALVIPLIGSGIVKVIGGFWFSGYRPVYQFSFKEVKSTSNFGLSVVGSNLAYYFASNSDYLIMGRFWPASAFGFYYFAYNKSRLISIIIAEQISGLILPAFSRIQDDLFRIRKAFLKGTKAMCLVFLPVHVLVIGLADPLVPWIFGEQWRPAVPVFRVFAALAFIAPPTTLVTGTLFALNLPRIPLYYNIFRVIVVLPTLFLLGLNGANIFTTAVVLLIIWYVQILIYLGYVFDRIKLSITEIWNNVKSIVVATGIMTCMLFGIRMGAKAVGWPEWFTVMISIILPATTFILLTWNSLNEIFQQVRSALLKK